MFEKIKWSIRYKKPICEEFHVPNNEMCEVLNFVLGINLEDADDTNDERPALMNEAPLKFKAYTLEDVPNSTKAMVIRKRDGDTAEDGTVTEKGERIFFSQNHLARALQNSHVR